MEKIAGRHAEKKLLINALKSQEAELIAVYGRRRVGKTFLIRSFYKDEIVFDFAGVHKAKLSDQLLNFGLSLMSSRKKAVPEIPSNWIAAFHQLQQCLEPKLKAKKAVVFFDEFPWIETPRSGFLSAFEHFWNKWASRQQNLVVVICGSAASWMIRNIVNNKGGLHNRITQKIRLLPFTLAEVSEYLQNRKILLDQYQLLQLYMAMGGVPYYLKNIQTGESAAQAIDRLCFTKDGVLSTEFDNLYRSLFDHAHEHIAVIRALAAKGNGLTRSEIISKCGLTSGGTTTKLLEELVESGFITPYLPFAKSAKDNVYKLSDEYSMFYLKFIEKKKATGSGTWLRIVTTATWSSWSGVAFEHICLKHVPQIKKALGISGILSEESIWRSRSKDDTAGTQIDMLIDRSDHCINICELKFAQAPFIIDKAYAATLQQKLNVFRESTKTRKTVFLTMITTYGVKRNTYYHSLVQNEIIMDALFVG